MLTLSPGSNILSEWPEIVADLQAKRLDLLSQGSRTVSASQFLHSRGDVRPTILNVIEDRAGNGTALNLPGRRWIGAW
jgi:hypothetical protein